MIPMTYDPTRETFRFAWRKIAFAFAVFWPRRRPKHNGPVAYLRPHPWRASEYGRFGISHLAEGKERPGAPFSGPKARSPTKGAPFAPKPGGSPRLEREWEPASPHYWVRWPEAAAKLNSLTKSCPRSSPIAAS